MVAALEQQYDTVVSEGASGRRRWVGSCPAQTSSAPRWSASWPGRRRRRRPGPGPPRRPGLRTTPLSREALHQLLPVRRSPMPATPVEFFFDPNCPFTWRTSRWITEVAAAGAATVTWRLMSLGVLNEGKEIPEKYREGVRQGGRALRALAAAQAEGGSDAVARLYTALGTRPAREGRGERRRVDRRWRSPRRGCRSRWRRPSTTSRSTSRCGPSTRRPRPRSATPPAARSSRSRVADSSDRRRPRPDRRPGAATVRGGPPRRRGAGVQRAEDGAQPLLGAQKSCNGRIPSISAC